MKAPVVVVVGTRPDAIKLLPVYSALKKQHVPTLLCATHQHVHMLDQVLQLFDVQPDISFNVMVDGQSLSHVTAMVLQKAQTFFCETKPALVVVQGDTTTSLAAALGAFYNNIPVAHVEAGLRTYDKRAPFPEEINRTILTQLADYHFAPTPLNVAALLRDHQAHRRVFNVGNTVVDALHYVQRQLQSGRLRISPSLTALFAHIVRQRKKLVLVTTHRRESFGGGMANIMTALKKLARLHKEYVFLLPMHLNPLVRTAIHDAGLQGEDGVVCLEPLPYHELVAVLERAAWVMTDSGGIQEEAVCLGKRVLVMRDVTERVELLWHGMGVLCGTAVEQIVAGAQEIMRQQPLQQCRHMYGDGFAAPRIVSIVRNVLGNAQDRVCSERRINHMKRVSVVGLGYIGLPTAILAAQAGYDVCGFDTDQEKVKQINSGNPVIFEPEISERLWKVLQSSFFKAHTELQYADCFIIAVPTPFKENKRADLSYVFKAADAIVKRLMPGNLVILESTVPVGTTEQLAQYLEEHSGLKLGIDFFVAHAPERVLPGQIFKELVENDRTIGGVCQQACQLAQYFYSKFVKGFIHITDDKSAEMAKLIENANRDVQIAFANQVAAMCQEAAMDAYHVIELANKHPRVKILSPTCGVGGHCIAVDPWFLIESFPGQTKLLQLARSINDAKPYSVIKQVLEKVDELKKNNVAKPKIFAMGLAFKPDVDDIRESPALLIAQELHQRNDLVELKVYDHNVPLSTLQQRNFDIASDVWRGIGWADIVLVLVKHKEFIFMHQDVFGGKVVIDTCGLLYEMQARQSRALLEGATKVETLFWKTGAMKDMQ